MPEALFDCHVHLGASDTGELYYPPLEGPEYLELMNCAGVERAIAFPPYRKNGYREANLTLARWCAGTGGRVRALARLGGPRLDITEPRLWLLKKKLKKLIRRREPDIEIEDLDRFAGIKLLPQLDGLPSPGLFAEVARRDMPILVHAGYLVPARWIERAILPMVETRIVLAHLGAFPDRQAELAQAIDLAARDARVFLDTSGIWIAAILRQAIERVPEKILFGSDCPLTTPAVAWAMLTSVVRDPGLRRRIGREAALEVFGC